MFQAFKSNPFEKYSVGGGLDEKIERKIENYIENDNYQGALLIVKDGEILFKKIL